MKRKIIIVGSIFVLALILLLPSIPAIQQKTIEDMAYSDFKEEIKTLDDDVKLPNLYNLVMFFYNLMDNRLNRVAGRVELIYDFIRNLFNLAPYSDNGKLLFVILIFRLIILATPLYFYSHYWYYFSEKLELNWDIKPI